MAEHDGKDEERLYLRLAELSDAAAFQQVIVTTFQARAAVDPPAESLSETPETIREFLSTGHGMLAFLGGRLIGGLLIRLEDQSGTIARLSRVCVLPEFQRHRVATELVTAACLALAEAGAREVRVIARSEFPRTIRWWQKADFRIIGEVPHGFELSRQLPVVVDVPTAEHMRNLGRQLADIMQAGDVIIASGDLGAGKTTLVQGLGLGMGVADPVISPTFVLSRQHPALSGGPSLIHVDAYRLGSAAELEDIDLDATLEDSVTVIEWGAGVAEGLADSRLVIDIHRSPDPADESRKVFLAGYGPRWDGVDLSKLVASGDDTGLTIGRLDG